MKSTESEKSFYFDQWNFYELKKIPWILATFKMVSPDFVRRENKVFRSNLKFTSQKFIHMADKISTFQKVADMLQQESFRIINKDDTRPWGGFYVIDDSNAAKFVQKYFPGENIDELKITEKISPKILIVAPNTRLSWQYHHRRAEIWRCIEGPVEVATSADDEQREKHLLQNGDIIRLKQGERHRLIGLDNWGIIAEIWQHTDAKNPSDEDDIVRVQDDFGR